MFTFYVQHVARYRDLYGNLATVVVLLVWLYVVALIAMIGCEFNVELERIRSPDEHE
jgi:membrane protein